MPFFGNKRRDFSIQPPRQQVDSTPFFVTDSANIDFTLDNLNLTADLTFTGVTAGTYGDATNIPVLQIDQWGRVTGVILQPISPSGLALEVNGIPNGNQTLLNLVAGTNMTITDDGLGNITFDATGGGGGIDGANSRRWGPINSSAAPPSGQLRLRTTAGVTTQDPSAVIDVRISRFDDTTADMQSWFTALNNYRTANPNKAYIQITDSSDNSVFGIYEIGSMVYTTIGNQYWTIGLTYVSGSVGLFTIGGTVTFSWVLFGADGTGGTGTVTSVSAGTGMNFSTITVSGSVDIDTTKVPYLPAGFSTGLLKWNGSNWIFDNSAYLTSAITSLNGLTAATQVFSTPGTNGTAPNWDSSTSPNHLLNIPLASAAGVTAGLISKTDYDNFTGKQSALTLTTTGTSGAATLIGATLNIPQYSGGGPGGNSIGQLTGDVDTVLATSPTQVMPSALKANLKTGSFGVTVDGVTTVIQPGQTGFVVIPYSGTITGWSITANVAGNIQFDVWKDALPGVIPVLADSIITSNFPTLSGTNFNTQPVTGVQWTTAFAAGDIFGFYVNSASTIKNATLTIRTTKS